MAAAPARNLRGGRARARGLSATRSSTSASEPGQGATSRPSTSSSAASTSSWRPRRSRSRSRSASTRQLDARDPAAAPPRSWMLKDRGPRMLEAEPEVTSAVDIFVKDLGIVLEAGRETEGRAAADRARASNSSSRPLGEAMAPPTTARSSGPSGPSTAPPGDYDRYTGKDDHDQSKAIRAERCSPAPRPFPLSAS